MDIVSVNPPVDAYITGVLDGTVIVGSWIRKAIQRHVRDLERIDIYFDSDAANHVIDFCQEICIPSAQSTPMTLVPWQQVVLAIVYGWKRPDGYRRFRRVYIEIAKKNGKTGLAAALALYHLIADGELSGRVFVAATALKQARECFLEAVAMRDKNPDLQAVVNKYGASPVLSLYVPETNSRLSPMTRGSDSQDGAVVSAAILDELHRWKTTDSLWSILRYGGDTRKQPLLICITTAGASANKSSLCWGEHEYITRILDGMNSDDEVAGFIFSLDPKDELKDESNWIKPNPSLGTILPLSALQNQYKEALGKPTAMGEYKRYRLNIWTDEVSDPAIDIEQWDECCTEDLSTHPDPVQLRKELIASLAGRTCFGGLDLAPKNDTSALVLLFPPVKTGEKWAVLEWFWCPASNIQDRVKRDHVPYDLWAKDGFIVPTTGEVDDITDVEYIGDQIIEINKQFNCKEIAYDPAHSNELIRYLAKQGFPFSKLTDYKQDYVKMTPPCIEFMRLVGRKQFAQAHNPVMRWQMNSLRWKTSRGGDLIMPDRARKREKIDGCASLIMALGRATDPDNIPKPKKQFFVVTA